VVRRVWPEVPQGVLAADGVVAKAARSAGAQRDCVLPIGANHYEADPGVARQRGDQPGMKPIDIGHVHSRRPLGQVDETESA
jgi:hypothetical protein